MISTLLGWVLSLFQLVLFVRAIVDLVSAASGGGGGVLYQARRITHGITEPVIAPVRNRIPPLRMGGIGIDLAFTIVFFAVLLLRIFVVPLIPF
jgi:YggT family protein